MCHRVQHSRGRFTANAATPYSVVTYTRHDSVVLGQGRHRARCINVGLVNLSSTTRAAQVVYFTLETNSG